MILKFELTCGVMKLREHFLEYSPYALDKNPLLLTCEVLASSFRSNQIQRINIIFNVSAKTNA